MFKFFIIIFLLTSCGSPSLDIPKSDHFDGKRFFNPHKPKMDKPFGDLIKWKMKNSEKDWPKWVEITQTKPKKKRTETNEVIVTFINHNSLLIQIDGVNIITDPIYSDRTSPVSWAGPKRVKAPGVKYEDLPPIDLIIISHNHYDSLDTPTIHRMMKDHPAKVLIGLGSKHYIDVEFRDRVIEMDWQDEHKFKDLTLVFLPTQHWSKRTLTDLRKSLWGSFAIFGSKKIYFVGDTGYFHHFKEAGEKYNGFDLALIPIGAYEPRWFMKNAHINPEESFKVHQDLKSEFSIGIHYGTFQLTDEAIDDPIKDLTKVLKENPQAKPFIVLENGESHTL